MKKVILVSIHCMTYNHINYIRQCLDGFVMQKTNFRFVAYIGDDCSTDGTDEIIREYERKYPNIIKGIYHSKNIGCTKNFFDISNMFKSKYVAICEGDDYWTDEYKLQKQVDFMEANPDYTICFHNVKRIFETGIKEDDIFPTQKMIDAGFTFENLLKYNFIQTNSVMYRWNAIDDVGAKFPSDILPGDWYLHLMFAKEGKIKFLEDTMSVYRVNANGVWYDSFKDKQTFYLKNCFKLMNFYDKVFQTIANKKYAYYKIWIYNYNLIKGYLSPVKYIKQNFYFSFKYTLKKWIYLFNIIRLILLIN